MIARLLAVLFALCFAGAAEADVVWMTTGSSCVPDETTTKFDRHKVGNASVQHAAGNVDLIKALLEARWRANLKPDRSRTCTRNPLLQGV